MPNTIPSPHPVPRVVNELDGVVANLPQALLNLAAEGRTWVELNSLDVIRRPELIERARHTRGFWSDVAQFDDVDCEQLNDAAGDGSIVLRLGSLRFDLDSSCGLPECRSAAVQTLWWTQGCGLFNVGEISVDGTLDLVQRTDPDMFVTSDPEQYALYRQCDYPAWLWTRPWNLHVNTAYRLNSVTQMLDRLGVQDRTAHDYVPPAPKRVASEMAEVMLAAAGVAAIA